METFLAGHDIDIRNMEGWATQVWNMYTPKVYVVLCFMRDGSVQWVRHPDIRDENGFEKYTAHHWKLDD
jgi:hypothetical protein